MASLFQLFIFRYYLKIDQGHDPMNARVISVYMRRCLGGNHEKKFTFLLKIVERLVKVCCRQLLMFY